MLGLVQYRVKITGGSPKAAWQPPMYKSNMAESPEKQTAWKCRLDQYPPMILNPDREPNYFDLPSDNSEWSSHPKELVRNFHNDRDLNRFSMPAQSNRVVSYVLSAKNHELGYSL